MEKSIPKFFRSKIVQLVMLAAVTAAVHLTYIPNGFTWLDHGDIEQRRALVPVKNLPQSIVLRYGATGFYRPVVTALHSIDHAVYGSNAAGFHLTNVLLHILAVLLVPFFLALFFPFSWSERLLAAGVFAVAPVHWLVVGSVSYRQELVMTVFLMLTAVFHAGARNGSKPPVFLSFACLVLALWSKESAVMTLPLLLFWEYIHRKTRHSNGRVLWGGYGIVCLVYGLLRMYTVPEIWRTSAASLPWDTAIGTRLGVLGMRIGEMVLPLLPSLSDATHVVSVFSLPALWGLSMVGGLIGLLLWQGITSSWGRAVVLFLIFLLPAFQILPAPRFSSSHYVYTASILAGVFFILILRMVSRRVGYAMICVWVVLAIYATWAGGSRFLNDGTLFAPAVARDPDFLEGHAYLGDAAFDANQYEEAKKHYDAALTVSPDIIAYVDGKAVRTNLAGVSRALGSLEEADRLLAETADLYGDPDGMIAYNRALIAYDRKKYTEVLVLLGTALKNGQWRRSEPYVLAGRAAMQLAKPAEAVEYFRRALPYLDSVKRKALEGILWELR